VSPLAWLLSLAVRFYRRWLSPLKPRTCRYHPTCSQYMLDALRIHGAVAGLWLGVRRILRCHPFHDGGYDPVPGSEREEKHPDHSDGREAS